MIRKIICYSVYILRKLSILYLIYDFINSDKANYSLFIISIIIYVLTIPAILISILLFGAPSNRPKEYIIKHISYRFVTEDRNDIILNYKNGIWELSHYGKLYLYNLKGWINIKKRVIDIIFIQLHNSYCNDKKITDRDYYKNFFKKYNVKVIFVKNNKKYYRKFKPSFILILKMIICSTQFKYQKYHLNNVSKRDLWDTFMIL